MFQRPLLALATLLITFAPAASAEVETWAVDPVHSSVGFKIRHYGISWVRGVFRDVGGNVTFDPNDLSTLKMDVTIDPASIDTGVQRRDDHLRNPDFFEVETYKEMRYVSNEAHVQEDGRIRVMGTLTMHGETHPVALIVEGLDGVADAGHGPKMGASARGALKRSQWGMTWVEALVTGGVNVGDEVQIEIEVELKPGE